MWILVVLTGGSLAIADPPGDVEALRGLWRIKSAKIGTVVVPANMFPTFFPAFKSGVVITADAIFPKDDPAHAMRCRFDASKSPGWLTLENKHLIDHVDASGKKDKVMVAQTSPGIYKIDGDELTLCWSMPDRSPQFDKQGKLIDNGESKVRPESFDGGSRAILFVFERADK
jgi:uncharacterized protein (TIGR03067 family)